jgi:hypothetical protein
MIEQHWNENMLEPQTKEQIQEEIKSLYAQLATKDVDSHRVRNRIQELEFRLELMEEK